MLFSILYLRAVFALDLSTVLIVFSDETPKALFSKFENYPVKLKVEDFNQMSNQSPAIIIDITENPIFLSQLDMISDYFQVIYLTLTSNCEGCFSRSRYYALPSKDYESLKISELLTLLKWKQVSLISCNDPASITFSTSLKHLLNIPSSLTIIEASVDANYMQKLMKKVVKSSGNQNFIISGTSRFIHLFQETLLLIKANKSNFNFLYPSFTASNVFLNNSLIFLQRGTNESKTEEDSKFLYLQQLIIDFFTLSKKDFFDLCDFHNCANRFEFVRITDKGKELAALIDENIKIINGELFDDTRAEVLNQIVLFVANGTSVVDEKFPAAITSYYRGASYGIEKANENQELKGFKYLPVSTSCGNLGATVMFTYECLGKMIAAGPVAYLSNIYLEGIYSNLISLRMLNKPIPQISPMMTTDDLNNKILFPEYFTIGATFEDLNLGGQSLVLNNFKWNEVIFYSTEENYLIYQSLKTSLIKSGIQILNPEKYAIFPSNYTRNDFEKYKDLFLFARKHKSRIFIIINKWIGYVLEGLYDVGYRKGEFISILFHISYMSIIATEKNPKYLKKYQELLPGNLVVGFKEWDGEYGENLKKEMGNSSEDLTSLCLTHDSFLAVHSSVKHMIETGDDFEDPVMLAQNIRKQRFVGCLGSVFFSSDSNQRSGIRYIFQQITLNETTEKLELFDLLVADRYAARTIKVLNSPQWVGSSETPGFRFDYGPCGFKPDLKQESNAGKLVIYLVLCFLLITVMVSAGISWRVFKDCENGFDENKAIALPDFLTLGFFVVEFVQIISLEPEDGIFRKSFEKINLKFYLSLQDYFKIDFESFWDFYTGLLVINLAYLLNSLVILMSHSKILKYYLFCEISGVFTIFSVIIGNLLYQPMILMFLEISDCFESTGEALSSAYLARDCTSFCFHERHQKFFSLGMISLFFFVFFSSIMRPFWEKELGSNLKTQNLYFSLISVFHVLFVVIWKIMQVNHLIFMGFCLTGAIAFFLVMTVKMSCFNLKKAKVYQVTVLGMSTWGMFMSSLYVWAGRRAELIPLNFVGLGFILAFGAYCSFKIKIGFKSDQGVSISNLIRFQFSKEFHEMFRNSVFKDERKSEFKDIKAANNSLVIN